MLPERLHKYLTEEEQQRMRAARREGRIEGRIEGLSLAILIVLEHRKVAHSPGLMARLKSQSVEELHVLIGRAVSVQHAEELLD